ncbi:MAG: HWE histidine kinase domain-containing protein [Erythrobacter sp.]
MAEANQVDITSCDREPIHLAGAVQSFGYLVAVSSDWIIALCSENVAEVACRSVDDLLGTLADDLFADSAVHDIRNRLQWLHIGGLNERMFSVDLFGDDRRFDVAVHLSDELIVIEFEPTLADNAFEPIPLVRSMMAKLDQAKEFDKFLTQAARQVRHVTEFDRVMVYRLLPDETGEVVADACAPDVESFKGLRYPATDIPKQARSLYLLNQLRIISDVGGETSPIVPQLLPDGKPLDLSMSVLRAVSPIHIEYLQNMGVGASMSISIIVEGKLWGLFACHHFGPKILTFQRRTVAELFGQMFSLELANRERQSVLQSERDGRAVHDRLMAAIDTQNSVFDNLKKVLDTLRDVIPSDGAAIWCEGEFASSGRGVLKEEMQGLVRFLNRMGASRVYSTDHLANHYEPAEDYADRVAGILAIPVSRKPRDYLVLSRAEIAQSVTWAGNPKKPAELGPNGVRLTPRKSFEAWQEVVRGKSKAWSPEELQNAESLRTTLLEVILRSVDESDRLRKAAQATQDLLIAELNHRVRNILTLVRGIVAQTGGSSTSVAQFASEVGGRIQALARAHDQLTSSQWSASSLRTMLETEIEAYFKTNAARYELAGPHVLLAPEAFSTLALVFHEMVTNSAKYGALSDSRGEVKIEWEVEETGSLKVSWSENGGPPVKAPTRRGFGSTIIERSIPFELQGEASIDYALTGVRARFLVPGHYVVEDNAPGEEIEEQTHEEGGEELEFAGTALLVEDNVIIAMEAEQMLLGLGFADVVTTSSVASAAKAIDGNEFAFALLDINLGSETSMPVADRLAKTGVPFVFASGYGDGADLPEVHSGVPVVTKPYSGDLLRRTISQMGE